MNVIGETSAVLRLGDDGWLEGVRRIVSPNCDARPPSCEVELVVVHAISLPPDEFGGRDIDRLFTNTLDGSAHPYFKGIAHLRVSAHFLIARDGSLTQYVSCCQRAWHAGVSAWRGRERCNDFSLGIELEGCDTQPFSERQYSTLRALLAALGVRYPRVEVVGHSDVAPGRKSDPGPFFDWRRSGVSR